MTFSIISAIGRNNELGSKNTLLWNLPVDMKHFKEITTGHPVVMGRRTFGSIGRALLNRRNIVVTNDESFNPEGVEVVESIKELIDLCKNDSRGNEEFFIIGGGMIYKQMIEYADKLYITHVGAVFPEADTFFPVIDKDKWQKISENKHEADDKNIYDCTFTEYIKK